MTAEKLEEIKNESKVHSINLTEWTSEALLKELCWAVYHETRNNNAISWRIINCYQELVNRINKRYGSDGEEPDYLKCIQACTSLQELMDNQEKCSKVLTASRKYRNESLRAMEGVLKVRTIIGDVWLP